MENNKAEAIRAARRKARILNNSEGRINRILGQSTDDDKSNDDGKTNKILNSKNVMQASTCNDILRNSNPTQQLPSPTSEEGCPQTPLTTNYKSTTDQPKIKSGASSNSSIIKDPKTSEVLLQDANAKAGTNYQGLAIMLWIMFGVVTRIVLDTNVSWITRNSALVPFLITYITVCFVKHRASISVNSSNDTSNFTIIEVALRLCGLPAHTIKLLMSIKKTSEAFLKTFSLFFIPFVMTHAFISVVESYGFLEESDDQ